MDMAMDVAMDVVLGRMMPHRSPHGRRIELVWRGAVRWCLFGRRDRRGRLRARRSGRRFCQL